MSDDLLSNVEEIGTIKAGSLVAVPVENLKLYLKHHGLSTNRKTINVEVLRLGQGTTDIDDDNFLFLLFQVKIVEPGDPKIDGTIMCVDLNTLMTVKKKVAKKS